MAPRRSDRGADRGGRGLSGGAPGRGARLLVAALATATLAVFAADPAGRADRFTLLSGFFGFCGAIVGYLAQRWGDDYARIGLILAAAAFLNLMLSVTG